MNSMTINQSLLVDPKASDVGTAEALNSRGIEASPIGKEPEASGSENNHGTYGFGPNKRTLLAGLSLMLEFFDEVKNRGRNSDLVL